MSLGAVEQAIADIRAGKLVIVADDEDRENEGDLVGAAEHVTPDMINFMATHGRGLICLTAHPRAVPGAGPAADGRAEHAKPHETAFTVSIDAAARFGVTTGISAADRAATIRVAIDPSTRAERSAASRARVSAARAARRRAAARRPDRSQRGSRAPRGSVPGRRDLRDPQRRRHDGAAARARAVRARNMGSPSLPWPSSSPTGSATERLVHRVAEARLPDAVRRIPIIGYRNDVDGAEHVALVYGDVPASSSVLVRMHSKCLTGDVFGSGALRLRLAAAQRDAHDRGRPGRASSCTSIRKDAASAC